MNKSQKTKSSTKKLQLPSDRRALLSGIVRCDKCQRSLVIRHGQYCCPTGLSRESKSSCVETRVTKRLLDDVAITFALEKVLAPPQYKQLQRETQRLVRTATRDLTVIPHSINRTVTASIDRVLLDLRGIAVTHLSEFRAALQHDFAGASLIQRHGYLLLRVGPNERLVAVANPAKQSNG